MENEEVITPVVEGEAADQAHTTVADAPVSTEVEEGAEDAEADPKAEEVA